jgi:hypothetical protein
MLRFFPRHPIEWSVHEPAVLQRLSLSLPLVAITAGVAIQLFELVLAHVGGWWAVVGRFVIVPIVLLGLATGHLGNFTVKSWLWRAPAFTVAEAATEALTVAMLTLLGAERTGTQQTELREWPGLAADILTSRLMLVLSFTLILAGVVQLVRRELLKREHRSATAEKIHEEHQRQTHHASQ